MVEKKKYTASMSYKELSEAGMIIEDGNSVNFKTGDWRSKKPIFLKDKCKQCLLCVPACPDNAIEFDTETGTRGEYDYSQCKGCGICYKICPFKAIDFVKD